jgi:hypothetical protein
VNPHASIVSDTKFNDHAVIPAAQYFVATIPEPTTLTLIGIAVAGVFVTHGRRILKKLTSA